MARLSDPQFPMVKKKKKKRPATYSRSKITKAKAKQPRNNTISMSPAEESNTEPVQYYVTEFVDLRLKEYDPKCKRDVSASDLFIPTASSNSRIASHCLSPQKGLLDLSASSVFEYFLVFADQILYLLAYYLYWNRLLMF